MFESPVVRISEGPDQRGPDQRGSTVLYYVDYYHYNCCCCVALFQFIVEDNDNVTIEENKEPDEAEADDLVSYLTILYNYDYM